MDCVMAIELPPLPYPAGALEPHISRRTLELHHDAHHKKYVDNVNAMIEGTPNANKTLEQLVRESAGKARTKKLFNNAAQAWNHSFFWQCMTPENGGGAPKGSIEDQVGSNFGSYDAFRDAFLKTATAQFGSGWAWLIANKGKLEVVSTSNAEIPMGQGVVPLLTCDVWEHAYYLDYQNKRERFVEAFLDHLANWQLANERFERVRANASETTADSALFL
jgi:superoxide dismutase, Fe-Mn family